MLYFKRFVNKTSACRSTLPAMLIRRSVDISCKQINVHKKIIMNILVFVTVLTTVYADSELWKPLETFVENIKNKTEEVQRFVTNQEQNFLENITNKTREVHEYVTNQEKNVEDSLNAYYEGLQHANNEVATYMKNTEEKLKHDFKVYMQNQNSTISKHVNSAIKGMVHEEPQMPVPDVELSVPGMIVANGYPCESHTIKTDDGYILTLHRIPRAKNIPPKDTPAKTVLLHHGLFGSSADWLFTGPKRALGYLLADSGYDVWMANVRGNKYSRQHAKLKTKSFQYWNFSWHDVAQHDLPAIIDYIIHIKGTEVNINYIGHSMGTTILFVLLSTKPEYNRKLNAGFALAPVAYMSDIKTPMKSLAPYVNDISSMASMVGSNEFMIKEPGFGWLGENSCDIASLNLSPCEHFLFMLSGFDEQQLDRSVIPVFLAHAGSGTSTKTVVHFAQEMNSGGRFQWFDYGSAQNLHMYGSTVPPEYSFENVTLPVALFWSKNDWLSGKIDVNKLYQNLRHPKELYTVPFDKFNHLDFLWAKDVKVLLYDKLLELLTRWDMNSS